MFVCKIEHFLCPESFIFCKYCLTCSRQQFFFFFCSKMSMNMKSILERNRNGNGKSSLMYWWTDKQSLQPSAQTSLNVRDKKNASTCSKKAQRNSARLAPIFLLHSVPNQVFNGFVVVRSSGLFGLYA